MIANTGTWPKRNPSVSYRLRGWLSIAGTILLTSTCVADIIVDFDDTGNVIYAMCISMAVFHCTVKHVILHANKEKMFQILKFLKDPIFTSHGPLNIYIVKKMRFCSFVRRLLMLSTWGTASLIIISPLFDISSRMLSAPFPVDMQEKPVYLYLLVWFMQVFGTSLTAWIIPAYDGLIVYLMGIAAAQLQILREKILHSADDFRERNTFRDFDRLVNKKLRHCVIHHIAIERRQKQKNFYFKTPVTSPNFGRSVFFFIAVVIELTNFCIPGNEIILQSEKIRDACYMSEWTNCGPSVRRTLFIIMERSKRPLRLTAAKFVVLSLSSLLS
ncbi:hypothetical protein ILUMI_11275, partial [Ignelater luminosus]